MSDVDLDTLTGDLLLEVVKLALLEPDNAQPPGESAQPACRDASLLSAHTLARCRVKHARKASGAAQGACEDSCKLQVRSTWQVVCPAWQRAELCRVPGVYARQQNAPQPTCSPPSCPPAHRSPPLLCRACVQLLRIWCCLARQPPVQASLPLLRLRRYSMSLSRSSACWNRPRQLDCCPHVAA